MFLLQKNIAVVLITLLLLKMMAIPLACLQYQFNKDFIAANLCENKEKPQLQCEGKCHLKKQIEKNSDAPNPTGEKSAVKLTITDFFEENSFSFAGIVSGTGAGYSVYYNNHYSHLHTSPVFHPPLRA
ncbi:MAG: hypothetical protein ACTHLE_23160 [Agriterribacter sp.]